VILLINPSPSIKSPWGESRKIPPLGLAYLAGALEKAGFQVEILDNYLLKHSIEHVKRKIEKLNPEIVGISCSSVAYSQCIETARAVKEVAPFCKVVVGGPHPSFMPSTLLQHPEIDYAVLGEGEQSIVKLASIIIKNRKSSKIATVPGIAYKHNGKIRENAPRFIVDLDEIPYPALHLLPMHLYDRAIEYLSVKPVEIMNVVRGCPYECTFCEVKRLWGPVCRAFSPNRVVGEIEHLINAYHSKGIYFIGDNFTIQKKRIIEMCKLIKKYKLDIEWVCDARVDSISRELLREMKSAGCRTIWFGVESGSPRIMKKVNRGITLQQVVQAFKLCKEEGIHTAGSFMLGIPGETINEMKATFKLARKLNPDWCQFNIFIATPGSNLYGEVIQKKLYENTESFVAYVKTDEFDYNLLMDIQRQFHRRFNISLKRILKKLGQREFWLFRKL
jgi:anaerobic magnesium-protoporphyrin IX monomethyl ester cyclase